MDPARWHPGIPPAVARCVGIASVPPDLRALYVRLPRPLALEAELPDDPARIPLAARQLLKLALGGTQLALARAAPARDGAALRLTVSDGARRYPVALGELAAGLRATTRALLAALCDAGDFTRTLGAFARQSAALETLRAVVAAMLRAREPDRALCVLLAGVTAGDGLGFNRAAVFVHDPAHERYLGALAVGPADAIEAHRIWEDVALEDESIEKLVSAAAAAGPADSPFQRRVRALALGADEPAVRRAVAAGFPLRCTRGGDTPAAFTALGAAEQHVLAPLRAGGDVRALLFADNVFTSSAVDDAQLGEVGFFVDQAALVYENLTLLGRVEALAHTDGLTGLLNRRAFDHRLADERQRGAPCGLLVVDLDYFKSVNDARGHAAGDAVLRAVSEALRAALTPGAVAARLGGDEFAVLLPGADSAAVLRAALAVGARARAAGVSLSIGGAVCPGDCRDAEALFAAADANLYRAKAAGRGRAACGAGAMVEF